MAPSAIPLHPQPVHSYSVSGVAKEGIFKAERALKRVSRRTSEQDLVLRTFRLLIADLCQQFKGGHPG